MMQPKFLLTRIYQGFSQSGHEEDALIKNYQRYNILLLGLYVSFL
jgi:hypothetical protein